MDTQLPMTIISIAMVINSQNLVWHIQAQSKYIIRVWSGETNHTTDC